MKRMKAALIFLGVIAVCGAFMMAESSCAQTGNPKPNEPAKPTVDQQKKGPQASTKKDGVIGYLESRDKIVTIFKGPNGAVYTIKTKDGKTLDTKLSEKNLQAKYPTLYNQVKHGLAGNDATLRQTQQVPVPAPHK